jgi:hypothetical protein
MNEALEKIATELRLLRETVERIETTLTSRPSKRKEPRPDPLTPDSSRQLYQEIREQFLKSRDTTRLTELLKRGHSDLRMFCSENNLAIDPKGSKDRIRHEIIKRLNEENQIRRTDPIHRSTG